MTALAPAGRPTGTPTADPAAEPTTPGGAGPGPTAPAASGAAPPGSPAASGAAASVSGTVPAASGAAATRRPRHSAGRLSFGKAFGATILVAGTMLGAGLLALPIISADMGFGFAAFSMIVLWALLTYTGLVMLEVCLAFPDGTEFQGMARAIFGERGAIATNVMTLLLQYTLSASYISGAASTWGFDLRHYAGLTAPQWLVALGYTLVVALCVMGGAGVVAAAGKVFFTLNLVILAVLVAAVEPSMRLGYLADHPSQWVFIWSAIPVFMTSFGFHTSIPTVVKYVGHSHARALRTIFIVGGVIPLVAYLAWIFVSLGALPRTGTHSFATVHAEGGTVGAFLGQIEPVIGSSLVPNLFYIFSTVVLVTSYLTVSLALTDILSASIKRIGRWRPSGLARRLMLGAVCFLPPFAVVVVYPDGFVPLLGVASIFCIIICMVFPAEALRRITRRGAAQRYGLRPPTYRVMWGWAGFVLVMASSAAILALQILNMADALPQ